MLTEAILLTGGLSATAFLLWRRRNRRYTSAESVAAAYDAWTDDRLLERLWGEHVHLGHYGSPPTHRDFRKAKEAFVHELVRWSGLDQLPRGAKVLDVGCGIGGSARILARDYGFDVLGISISSAQVRRATELTPDTLRCQFEVMDALDLQLADQHFDAVWSVEAGPHMPDKQRFADDCFVLRWMPHSRGLEPQRRLRWCDEPQRTLGDDQLLTNGPSRIRQHQRVPAEPGSINTRGDRSAPEIDPPCPLGSIPL